MRQPISPKPRMPGARAPGFAAITSVLAALMMLEFAASAPAQCLITDFEGLNPALNGRYLFRRPNFSGSTVAYVDAAYKDTALVSSEQARSGVSALRVDWKFKPVENSWLRLTTYRAGTVAAVYPNPQMRRSEILSFWVYVPATTPDFYVTLGARETSLYAGCGQNGGTSGQLEWVGASERRTQGGPLGKLVSVKDQWVQLKFVLLCEPVLRFVGNGSLDYPQSVLEHLAITPAVPGEAGPFVIYLDDFAVESAVEFLEPVAPPDAPHLFAAGQTIPLKVRFCDCQGKPVTTDLTTSLDVKGIDSDGVSVFHDVDETPVGIGDGLTKTMMPIDHHFQFNLKTLGFAPRTGADDRFYRAEVIVTDNWFGFEMGRGSLVLESR